MRNKSKYFLCSALWLAALFDIVTFLWNIDLVIFETNPLYLLSKSIVLVLLFKCCIIAAITGVIMFIDKISYFNSYFFVIASVYLIFSQTMGGISNMQVSYSNPEPSQALPEKEAIKAYFNFQILWVYFPLLMGLIAFKIWELCYIPKKND